MRNSDQRLKFQLPTCVVLLCLILSGCQKSEVDKCVEAGMRKVEVDLKKSKALQQEGSLEAAEAGWRLACLEAQGGKKE